jgi:phage tail-like protein
MPNDDSKQTLSWPLPNQKFQVKWDDLEFSFQEITGMDIQDATIEYRQPKGRSHQQSPVRQVGSVSLKRGVLVKGPFMDWYQQFQRGTIHRSKITISLLDETGNPKTVWELMNAWPSKVSFTDMKSDENEMAVESMEIMHEGISEVSSSSE